MEYEDTRYQLFTNSFVGKQIARSIRKKYSYNSTKKGFWISFIKKKYPDQYMLNYKKYKDQYAAGPMLEYITAEVTLIQVFSDLTKVANLLKLNHKLFRWYVVENYKPKVGFGDSLVREITYDSLIDEEGIYIKINEDTTKKEVDFAFKIAKKWAKTFTKEHFKYVLKPKKKRYSYRKDEKLKINICLEIEKQIENINKFKKSDRYQKDYLRELLTPAIERVITIKVPETNIEQDNMLLERYKGYYYDIIDRYNLPTVRDLNKIYDLIGFKP